MFIWIRVSKLYQYSIRNAIFCSIAIHHFMKLRRGCRHLLLTVLSQELTTAWFCYNPAKIDGWGHNYLSFFTEFSFLFLVIQCFSKISFGRSKWEQIRESNYEKRSTMDWNPGMRVRWDETNIGEWDMGVHIRLSLCLSGGISAEYATFRVNHPKMRAAMFCVLLIYVEEEGG